MTTIRSYLGGTWQDGTSSEPLLNPATEEPVAMLAKGATDWPRAVQHARAAGPLLAQLTFAERGALLGRLAKLIHTHRDELIGLAIASGGNTRGDAKFDIDGATGTLAFYAELGDSLGAVSALLDRDAVQLTRSVRFFGQHLLVPRRGVAVHINAFNFPAWGMVEKLAVALLAGVPVITKPASSTALVAHRIMELIVEARLFPEGAVSFIAGPTGELLDQLGGQDALAFTGSSETAKKLRAHPGLIAHAVRVNVEADSLNAAVLGPDLAPDSEAYGLFIADVVRDMTQKTGQKCTAIRRVLVPEALLDQVRADLVERLAAVKVGDPARDEVTMGPLATRQQLDDVRAGLRALGEECDTLFGDGGNVAPLGAPAGKGYFVSPVLFLTRDAAQARRVHELEVFGPVATLIPYSGDAAAAVELVARGGGGLVASVYSDDRAFAKALVLGLGPYHGRLFLGSSKLAGHAVGPGTVLPQLTHGGPGRAGGGEELGGLFGLGFYLQRTAVAADRPVLDALFTRSGA